MDNFDFLTEVLSDYCIKHNLPLDMSADDMIYYFYNNDDSFKENPYQIKRFSKKLWPWGTGMHGMRAYIRMKGAPF